MESKNLDTIQPAVKGESGMTLKVPGETIETCVATAQQLLRVIKEERRTLENFQADALLAILPQKQHLVGSLHHKLASLQDSMADGAAFKTDPRLVPLRECLGQIEQANRANAVFIENTLAYYEDFYQRFMPFSYGSPDTRRHRRDCQFYRGRAFRKEV